MQPGLSPRSLHCSLATRISQQTLTNAVLKSILIPPHLPGYQETNKKYISQGIPKQKLC